MYNSIEYVVNHFNHLMKQMSYDEAEALILEYHEMDKETLELLVREYERLHG